MANLSDVNIKTWGHLKDVILCGRDAYTSAHGMKLFEYMQSDEEFCKLFSRAMSESSIMVMEKVVEFCKLFSRAMSLSLITSKYPHIMSINFDLPPVLARAPLYPG
ncbi:unnamed protein product [Arabis nemorensis]|uniref:O-methyltransferase C-terminal domain-containing protein n=1 Tax=Arabis nemorensis TaxID=586526 RepID=A0A565CR15_9BRAS|nr:unnamed protein product [Arabis nemorensis]